MATKQAFAKGLREVRFHLCPTGSASDATRTFLRKSYPTMKKSNPETPILIRECTGIQPKLWARYAHGKEKSESLSGLSEKEIEDKVTGVVQQEFLS